MANVRVDVEINRENLSSEFLRIGRRAVNETSEEIAAEARRRVPVRTGHTRSTIRTIPARAAGPFDIRGAVTAGGATQFLEKGTRPHIIRARRAAALRFEMGGRVVFARSVHHPGTRARPFLTEAAAVVAARHRR
jgi:hypothetical protein